MSGAHAVVLATEGEKLRALDVERVSSLMELPKLLVDDRNGSNLSILRNGGLLYRGSSGGASEDRG